MQYIAIYIYTYCNFPGSGGGVAPGRSNEASESSFFTVSPQLVGSDQAARQNIKLATISRNNRGRRSVTNSFTPLILTLEKDRPQDVVVAKTGCSMVRANLLTFGATCVCVTFVRLIQKQVCSSLALSFEETNPATLAAGPFRCNSTNRPNPPF